MSFVTKLFVILSLLASMIFLLVAGALVARQENYKHRYTAELVERQRDDQLQDRLRNRLAAAKERRRRQIVQYREKIMLQKEKVARARHAKQFADMAQDRVARAMNRFSGIANDFDPIVSDYSDTLTNLVARAETLSGRRNAVVDLRAQTWLHLAQAQAEVGRLREHLNVLDYRLYVLREANEEKRELIRLYREADPTLSTPGYGGPQAAGAGATVTVVNPERGLVVINKGRNEGVAEHMIFTVTRGNEYCGQIEITSVHDVHATGRILPGKLRRPIEQGDTLRPRAAYGAALPG